MLRGYQQEQELDLSRQILARIKTLPGVRAASFSFPGPFLRGRYTRIFSVEGHMPRPGEDMLMDCLLVMPEFFESLGMALRQGRTFTPQDNAGDPKVAVINESMANYFFPQRNPLGKRLSFVGEDPHSASLIEIVGVVKDARYRGLRETVPLALGARPRNVLKLIVKQGVWLTLIGVGLGLVAAFGVMRLLRGFLFDVNPTDSLTFTSIALLLTITALLACYIPARRASKVDPLQALRHECAVRHEVALIIVKRDKWIHFRRPPRWQVAGQTGDGGQQ